MPDADALKSLLASAIRLLVAEGLMDFHGHMSARLPGTERVLINGRQASRSAVSAADIVTVDLQGRPLPGEGDAPTEVPIHTRIYAVRPDVCVVAHLHPQWATVFSIAGRPLVPVFILGAVFPEKGLPVYDDPDLIRTTERADALARTLGTARAVLLRGHGAVVVGEDIETCFTTSIWMEENAKKQLWASVLGTPRVFTEEETRRVGASLWERRIMQKTWEFFVAKGRREGLL
ncbi:MAG TPA: class II aldolase/adducin family protein [bacterium]|nr:class II aldolase/adducin family protein [bacterium]